MKSRLCLLLPVIALLCFMLASCDRNDNGGNITDAPLSEEQLAVQGFNTALVGFESLSHLQSVSSAEGSEHFRMMLTSNGSSTEYIYDGDTVYTIGTTGQTSVLSIVRTFGDGSVKITSQGGNVTADLIVDEEKSEKSASPIKLPVITALPRLTENDLLTKNDDGIYPLSSDYVSKLLAALDFSDGVYELIGVDRDILPTYSFSINMKSFSEKGEIGIRITDPTLSKSLAYTTVTMRDGDTLEALSVATFGIPGKFTANLSFDQNRIATGSVKLRPSDSERETAISFSYPENPSVIGETASYDECKDFSVRITQTENNKELLSLTLTAAMRSEGLCSGKLSVKLDESIADEYIGELGDGVLSPLGTLECDLCFDITLDSDDEPKAAAINGKITVADAGFDLNLDLDLDALEVKGATIASLTLTGDGASLGASVKNLGESKDSVSFVADIDITIVGVESEITLTFSSEIGKLPDLDGDTELYLFRAEKFFSEYDRHMAKIEEINEWAANYNVSNSDPDMYITYDSKSDLAYVTTFSGFYIYTACVVNHEDYEYFAAKHNGRFRDYTDSPFLQEVKAIIEMASDWTAPEGYEKNYGTGSCYVAYKLSGYDGYCIVNPYALPKSAVIVDGDPDGKLYKDKVVHTLTVAENGSVIMHDFDTEAPESDTVECSCGCIITKKNG